MTIKQIQRQLLKNLEAHNDMGYSTACRDTATAEQQLFYTLLENSRANKKWELINDGN